jgi:hypothetical protein
MTLKYDNVFEARLGALDKSLHDKECSELLISIHGILDFENAPIKTWSKGLVLLLHTLNTLPKVTLINSV